MDGSFGRASTPSGTSTGRHEACELRDGDPAAYGGHSVLTAVSNIRSVIAASVIGKDALDQRAVDRSLVSLDGSPSLQSLGANAVLATSLAIARAAATHLRQPLYRYIAQLAGGSAMNLPMPMTNLLSGMDFQDFLVIPVGANSYSHAVEMLWKIREGAAEVMKGMALKFFSADDGGWSPVPSFARAEQALELMLRSFEASGLRPGIDVSIGLDVAASELFKDDRYTLPGEKRQLSREEMITYLVDLLRRFPIVSVEDALDQDDWTGWSEFSRAALGIQVVGDDLFATNLDRIEKGIEHRTANAAIIKVNQNGTLSGTLAVMEALRSAGFGAIVAGRSGDTEDTFIADLSVGTGAGQIKIGAFRNTERLGKYNQLLRIEEEAGVPFAGASKFYSGK